MADARNASDRPLFTPGAFRPGAGPMGHWPAGARERASGETMNPSRIAGRPTPGEVSPEECRPPGAFTG